VYTEASAIMRAVAADFYFTVGVWKSLQLTVFGTNQGASTIICKAFQDFCVGIGIHTTEQYSVLPDRFDCCFI
jgi:hypothetical protein